MIQLNPFPGEEHRSFHWSGGRTAALLVHGFPGTPAELRPLATSLHRAGWTVQAPLLPGLGPDIETLAERQASDWVAAVQSALIDLKRDHRRLLLVGYSMGAALALTAAAAERPDGLILIAPFQQLGRRWQQLAGLLLKPFIREMRPFRKTDFSDPQVRQGISNFFGSLDLDSPEVQQYLRGLAVPTSIFDQLNRVGRTARSVAGQVDRPLLVVQGRRDEVVQPAATRRYLTALAGPLRYQEVDAGHNLLDPNQPAWLHVEQSILDFAQLFIDPE